MAATVYVLCSITSMLVMLLLFRGFHKTRARLLLWSALCFLGLTVNNVLVFVDLVIVPDVDLLVARNVAGLLGMAALLYGLIWDSQ